MSCIQIIGGIPLSGEIEVQGCKNAVLPLMAASVLHRGITVIHRCPRIRDVVSMSRILEELGVKVTFEDHSIKIDAREITNTAISDTYATRLRASVVLMGSVAGRMGRIKLPYPGGCVIGKRPVDYHIKVMETLGAEVAISEEEMCVSVNETLWKRDNIHISLPFPSVGATQTAIFASVLRPGKTWIYGCALEPEIEEVCRFLIQKGARIYQAGKGDLCIEGVKCLKDSQYELMSDRIVAGTYLFAAMATRGCITVKKVNPEHLTAVLDKLWELGARMWIGKEEIFIDARRTRFIEGSLKTDVYPGFPTDLQSPFVALICTKKGNYKIEETVFEHRFQILTPLKKMGAQLEEDHGCLWVRGTGELQGTEVEACELRGGAALVIAGLAARGKTIVKPAEYIKRGYEDICGDLKALGADIMEIE